MGRLALIVLTLAGCRQVFGINDPVPPDAAFSSEDGPVDAGFTGPCSQMSMLADDFSSNLDVMWPLHVSSGGSVAEGNGNVTLTTDSSAILSSLRFYDLRESKFSIAITDSFITVGDTWSLALDSQRKGYGVRIDRDTMSLTFSRVENGTVLSAVAIMYNATAHKYLQVAESGGMTRFETSPDGATWTTQAMYPLDYATFMRVSIAVTTTTNAPFTVTVTDANHGTPTGTACPIAQLQDDFSGMALDEKWARSGATNGTVSEHDGVAELAYTPTGITTSAYLYTSTIYDLTRGAFVLEIPKMIQVSMNEILYVTANGLAGQQIAFDVESSTIRARELMSTQSTIVGSELFDAASTRWLRLRNDGMRTFWEASGDGVTWRIIGEANDVTGMDRAEVAIQITGTASGPDSLQVDNVGLPP